MCIRYSISNYLVKSTFNTHSWQPVLFDYEGGAHFYLSLEVKKEKRFIWHTFLSFIVDLKDIQTWWLNVFDPHLQRKTRLRMLKKKVLLSSSLVSSAWNEKKEKHEYKCVDYGTEGIRSLFYYISYSICTHMWLQ